MNTPNRRNFMRGVAALAATSIVTSCKSTQTSKNEPIIRVGPATEEAQGLGSEESAAPMMSDGTPAIRAITREADGSTLSADRMKTLTARDLRNDPLPQPIVLATGRARIALNKDEPIQLCMRLRVPDFGEIYCYADNNGDGYTKPETRDFVHDAAATRIRRVREAYELLKPSIGRQDEVERRLNNVSQLERISVQFSYRLLAEGLHAGEALALANARTRISRFPTPRHDFKFGVMVSGYDTLGPEYAARVNELFNYATASWYYWRSEAEVDTHPVEYSRMDSSINWCLSQGIQPKTFGYLYMTKGAVPEWMRPIDASTTKPTSRLGGEINTLPNSEPSTAPVKFNPKFSYDRIKDIYRKVITATAARYNGKLLHMEVMNEAHDKANIWGMNHEQILDMAKMAFAAARAGSPVIQRQMNHCCMWGEYGRHANPDGSRRWSPWQFVKACFDHGIDYETIGLQLYYPQQDVFEIDRMLDRFTEFNKPIQITEIATASEDGLDPGSMRPKTYAPPWHGTGWSRAQQADWTEAVYTLLYSKPLFTSVTWWDFCDAKGRFWPFGGLLDDKLKPKPAYDRIRKLQQDWGVYSPK